MTTLTFHLADALSAQWSPGDEIVLTSLDHDANIRPWVRAAERAGTKARWAEFDRQTGELDPAVFDHQQPTTRPHPTTIEPRPARKRVRLDVIRIRDRRDHVSEMVGELRVVAADLPPPDPSRQDHFAAVGGDRSRFRWLLRFARHDDGGDPASSEA
jgi:hypothetical protein